MKTEQQMKLVAFTNELNELCQHHKLTFKMDDDGFLVIDTHMESEDPPFKLTVDNDGGAYLDDYSLTPEGRARKKWRRSRHRT